MFPLKPGVEIKGAILMLTISKSIFTGFHSKIPSQEQTLHHGPFLQNETTETNRMKTRYNSSEQWTQSGGKRGVERFWESLSSWGQQVLLNQSYTVPTLLWCVLGRAVLCRAVPARASGGGATSPSGEFRLAECDGQLQVLLFLLGEPGQPLLFLSLALALCPLYHVFLCWILLREHKSTHRQTKPQTHTHTQEGWKEQHICKEIWGVKGDRNTDKDKYS